MGILATLSFSGSERIGWVLLLTAFVSTGLSLSERLPVQNVCAITLMAAAIALGHAVIETKFRPGSGDVVFYKPLCFVLVTINARILVRWTLQRNPPRRNIGLHILWLSSVVATTTFWAGTRLSVLWSATHQAGAPGPSLTAGEAISLVGIPWLIQLATLGWWIKTKPAANKGVPGLALLNLASAALLGVMARV